jgi:hypothetical protein
LELRHAQLQEFLEWSHERINHFLLNAPKETIATIEVNLSICSDISFLLIQYAWFFLELSDHSKPNSTL